MTHPESDTKLIVNALLFVMGVPVGGDQCSTSDVTTGKAQCRCKFSFQLSDTCSVLKAKIN